MLSEIGTRGQTVIELFIFSYSKHVCQCQVMLGHMKEIVAYFNYTFQSLIHFQTFIKADLKLKSTINKRIACVCGGGGGDRNDFLDK